jgi:hypothetical protein
MASWDHPPKGGGMSNTKYVYFMKPVGAAGPVKIGCSGVPLQRLENLSTWAPEPLEIVVTIPGDFDTERSIHETFADLHSHREWFRADQRLTDLMQKLLDGVPLAKAVDLGGTRYKLGKKAAHWARHPEKRLRCSYSHRLGWAERKSGKERPDDIRGIMYRWEGRHPDWPGMTISPSAEDFARLEEVIANPATHMVVPSWRRAVA